MLGIEDNICSGNMSTVKPEVSGTEQEQTDGEGDGGGGNLRNIRNVSKSSSPLPSLLSTTTLSLSSSPILSLNVNDANTNKFGVAVSAPHAISTKTSTTKLTTSSSPPPSSSSLSSSSSITNAAPAVVVHYFASFHNICVVTALLPLATLFTCFVTAYVFQYDDVHETHCRVYNIVPSISAITGISPQRYFWRLSIALHLGPRIPIAFVYKNYYSAQLQSLSSLHPQQVQRISYMIMIILFLNCIEVASLGGVTYVSNRENYPIHEKIFITFMICSLCHMLLTIKLNAILHGDETKLTLQQRESIKWKKILFALSILSTIGLLIFFAKHRFYCHDLAFSWFAFFEYLIAVANMLFHFTIIWDFPSQYMLVVQGSRTNLEQIFNAPMPKKIN